MKLRDAAAAMPLAIWSDYGLLSPKNPARAAKLFREAARLGNPLGLVHLGLSLISGHCPERSGTEAESLFKEAVDLGPADGYAGLGIMNAVGTCVPRNPSKAESRFIKGAKSGSATAQSFLAHLYLSWTGGRKKAVKWFEIAAANGNTEAMTQLAVLLTARGPGPRISRGPSTC